MYGFSKARSIRIASLVVVLLGLLLNGVTAQADTTQTNWRGGPLHNATYTLRGGSTPSSTPNVARYPSSGTPKGGYTGPVAKVTGGVVLADDPPGYHVPLCQSQHLVNGQNGIQTQGNGTHVAVTDVAKFKSHNSAVWKKLDHGRARCCDYPGRNSLRPRPLR